MAVLWGLSPFIMAGLIVLRVLRHALADKKGLVKACLWGVAVGFVMWGWLVLAARHRPESTIEQQLNLALNWWLLWGHLGVSHVLMGYPLPSFDQPTPYTHAQVMKAFADVGIAAGLTVWVYGLLIVLVKALYKTLAPMKQPFQGGIG